MWRVNFVSEIPGTEILIRPTVDGKMLRSDKSVVFRKMVDGAFRVQFLTQGTPDYSGLISSSEANGILKKTSARSFGYL